MMDNRANGKTDGDGTEQDHAPDATTQRSATSSGSRSSSTRKAAIEARAKVEAARARATYCQREVELKIEEARLAADMKVKEAQIAAELSTLEHEKEVAAALAEAQVLEEAAELESCERSEKSQSVRRSKPASDSLQRTRDYVEHHSHLPTSFKEPPELERYTPLKAPYLSAMNDAHAVQQPSSTALAQQPVRSTPAAPSQQPARSMPAGPSQQPARSMPAAPVQQLERSTPAVHPQHPAQLFLRQPPPAQLHYSPLRASPQQHCDDTTGARDIARYLVRRELVNSGLIQFNERPENYWAWKSSFFNAIEGLNLTASEELDLLTKWLGKESSEHVTRIRSMNVTNPEVGRQLVWERLEECYGSPEVIERALFDRIENFPKISPKDSIKLRELGDLLMELHSAKNEGYLPGLSYLDTARGVMPIVEKLPYSLQERWLAKGSQYKEQHRVCFPPFAFFTDFICSEARRRNDPSFTLPSAPSKTSNKPSARSLSHERSERESRYDKRHVSTHKTEVRPNHSASQSYSSSSKPDDIGKQCPIHQKPHPLKKCRGFRSKPLEERKAFLKDIGACYRCCSSTTHQAKNCKATLKCFECESENHIAALHPGPAPWNTKDNDPASEHGGESEEEVTQPAVNSKCTEVCGSGQSLRSCSKICLAKVYPKAHPDRAINVYIVLDDQSNRSLARSEFFDLFQIRGSDSPYTLRTCAGVTETSGRRATGFLAESVDGKTTVVLPTLIECNYMPSDRSEIPTPEAAQHHSHLKSIAQRIPHLDPEAQILILLGRDILQVHKVRDQRNGPHSAPYGQRLDLGWVIIGDVCLGSAHKPAAVTSCPANLTPNTDPPTSKASKKKKPQKNTAAASTSVSSMSGMTTTVNTISVETAAQKENVPEKTRNKLPSSAVTAPLTSGLANGFTEKTPPLSKEPTVVPPHPNTDPPLEQEEEFPALMTKKPPPGFKTSFPMKASTPAPSTTLPTPPPGLGISAPKPPPGFTGIPLNSNVVEPAPSAVNPPPKVSGSGYLVPEDFHQRNLELIQSIRKYLQNDESKFNQFKNYSAQFRQGVISAAQYHRSCKDLLGDDFNRIFNELLVLLPDTGKQQELLTAHGDSKALEKQSEAGGGKVRRIELKVTRYGSTKTFLRPVSETVLLMST